MTNEQQSGENLSRRGVLKGTAALASTAAISGEAGAYRDAFDFRMPVAQNDEAARTFTLTGIVGGWLGVTPHEIDGQSNPPLRLVEGETHEVVWVNGDGSMHNFNICAGSAVAEDVEVLEATETVTEQGEFTSLEFTATEEMDEYFCMPHPAQMRGPIELIDPEDTNELVVHVEDENGDPLGAEVYLDDMHSFSNLAARPDPFTEDGQGEESEEAEPGDGEGGDGDGEGQQEEAPSIARFDMLEDGEYDLEVWTYGYERVSETVEIDGEDAEVTVTLSAVDPGEPTETYSMRLEEGQWVGVEPDAIADATNPTLDLEAGETYAIEWENAIGRHQPEAENRSYEPLPGHNLAIASNGETTDWNTYVRSDFTAEEGATQTVEFVAEENMAIYLDQSQLEAVGEISVGGQSGGMESSETETAETSGNETATVDGNETATGDGNETVEATGNETAEVDGNETVESEDNETAEVDGNETTSD
ncbi:plastocyanin/azurin family copper-binding protein [Halopiger aswanensis]|uniref:Copper binding plastocyanin/azurin family protein n=1 Tax=Halopiger aswanensis TaxID=148449 RepID=A0A419WHM0_9EURY|nr:plastocyanin/azurin family copper-binding protein [Halopiger aswanensis]RKD94836.1 copper binding plastocyanin/azurin family protein [Halopiger aswanensis]